ncbi:unnamed protein product [Thlaspi arvense]|uniref:Uncharacterized protein n=1 Tax=Thlaspi arvense TaxID=13288 RepID=A0AAU9RV99_THLAR|nr:unnamed protein product [Thlaspi arvense]
MAPSAAMLILSHPLLSHKRTTNQSPSPPAVKSMRVSDLLLPWRSSDGEDGSAVSISKLYGDLLEKHFQEALELSFW